MFSKVLSIVLLVACAQAQYDHHHGHATSYSSLTQHLGHAAAPAHYAAPIAAYAAPAHTYAAPAIAKIAAPAHHATSFSSFSNGIAHAAPAYAAPAYTAIHAAPAAIHSYAAPAAIHSYAAPAIHHAAPLAYKHIEPEHYAHPKYQFSYGVEDHHTGDIKSQEESRDGDIVKGSYSLIEADGTKRTVHYTADHHNGFNAIVSREGHGLHPQHATKAIIAPIAKAVIAAPIHGYSPSHY